MPPKLLVRRVAEPGTSPVNDNELVPPAIEEPAVEISDLFKEPQPMVN